MNDVTPVVSPDLTNFLAIGLVAFFVLVGVRYAWRAFLLRFVFNEPFNDPDLQAMFEKMPPDRSMIKALAAFAVAAFLAWLLFYGAKA